MPKFEGIKQKFKRAPKDPDIEKLKRSRRSHRQSALGYVALDGGIFAVGTASAFMTGTTANGLHHSAQAFNEAALTQLGDIVSNFGNELLTPTAGILATMALGMILPTREVVRQLRSARDDHSNIALLKSEIF